MAKAVVALVGRPNVGKSTIFNRLVGSKVSIIEDTPGVTRDRIYGNVTNNNGAFHLIDTGGIDASEIGFNEEIIVQANLAIDEADLVLFVVDGKEGLTSNDYVVRDMLVKNGKEVIVVINKIDSKLYKEHEFDFYELGFSDYAPVSGEQNVGIYSLLDMIIDKLPVMVTELDDERIKFSVIGRPNVGKSSLVNALLNEERVIVSDVPGTTRDAIDTVFTYYEEEYVVIDTAGMRKKGKVYESIERYSLLRSMKAIDRSNVCLVIVDASTGVAEHDKHIAGYALEAGKAIVIVVNKWDLIDASETSIKEFEDIVRREFHFINYAPIVFVSSLTKKRIHTVMPEVIRVYNNSRKKVPTNIINRIITDAYTLNIPPSYKSKRLKIYFSSQVNTAPPTFNIQVNSNGLIHFSYERYLENKIRESIDFSGTPIVLQFKNKGEKSF